MFENTENRIPRREFVKATLAIGGTQALAACTELEGFVEAGEARFPRGPEDLSTLPERQHYWDDALLLDMAGNTALPQHQLLLFLDYVGSVPPTDEERAAVEGALQTLERAHQRGTGGDVGAQINKGLLFMIGYSRSFFDRFETPFPSEIGLQRPEEILEAVGEEPALAEDYDAVMVFSADFASMLLEVEEALFGEVDAVNGIAMEETFVDVFEPAERRSGFVGSGVPREEIDGPIAELIDENAPMSMGFQSGFTDNLPPNDEVAFLEPPFEDGTTLLVSQLEIDLARWYDHDHGDRVELMFSTEHSEEDVGHVGENLGSHSGITEEHVESLEDRAAERGRIGHSEKTATARDDRFEPTIHRRSESIATDVVEEGVVGFNFSSIQRDTERFVEVRKAMNPEEYDADVPDDQHGIIDYLETTSRATFLVPPRRLRALPDPQPAVDSYR